MDTADPPLRKSSGILPDVFGSLFGLGTVGGADPAQPQSPAVTPARAPQGLLPQKRVGGGGEEEFKVDDARKPRVQERSALPPDVHFVPADYGLHHELELPLEMNPPSMNGEQPLYNL